MRSSRRPDARSRRRARGTRFVRAVPNVEIRALHRISTAGDRAQLRFVDQSILQLSEDALLLIYGKPSSAPAKGKPIVELAKGGLLSKLEALEERAAPVVATPAATVTLKRRARAKALQTRCSVAATVLGVPAMPSIGPSNRANRLPRIGEGSRR